MARGRTILTCLMWLLLVFSITLCASATAGARLGTSQQGVGAAISLGNLSCFDVAKYAAVMIALPTKILLRFSLRSVILPSHLYATSKLWHMIYNSLVYVGKNYMFLLCNGLLVLIATSSVLIGSCSVETDIKAEKAVKMSKGGSQTEPEAEPKGSISKETVVAEYDQREEEVALVVELEDEGEEDRSKEGVSVEEDEDEDEEVESMCNVKILLER
ncbi:hypothetical protein Goshw_029198 [Gossypium schwendimanii]|uniref:Uncharacterized protein n=1 Tax=Gossypium schwendimanii TaxID=34291 RepID=A0A7J9MQG0_GOSSC|nr:hypothetical protein [Gossypium schwendimanii]